MRYEWSKLGSHAVSANELDAFKRRSSKFMDGEGWSRWVEPGLQELPRVG